MPVLIAPQDHKVVAVLLQVESVGTADVSVLVIEQHRRLGGEQAALNGAGIQLIAIGKAGGGFQPELPAGKVVVVGPVVGDIGDDPALNGVIARQNAVSIAPT